MESIVDGFSIFFRRYLPAFHVVFQTIQVLQVATSLIRSHHLLFRLHFTSPPGINMKHKLNYNFPVTRVLIGRLSVMRKIEMEMLMMAVNF